MVSGPFGSSMEHQLSPAWVRKSAKLSTGRARRRAQGQDASRLRRPSFRRVAPIPRSRASGFRDQAAPWLVGRAPW